MMNIYAIFIISSFSAVVFVLGYILFDMIKNGTTYGRQIPMPPKHLKPKKDATSE
jgi:hypothetical protein